MFRYENKTNPPVSSVPAMADASARNILGSIHLAEAGPQEVGDFAMNCSKSTTTDRTRKNGPRLWIAALFGGAIALGAQLAEGFARSIWSESEIIGFLDWPAFCAIKVGTNFGIIETHDAITVLFVFCLYYALLGAVVGVLIALALRCFGHRRNKVDRM